MNKKTQKIGIGITTHNRHDTFSTTLKNIKKYLPTGAELVIVDDASKKPVKGATFRFDKNVGIAMAKNKCFELLEHCDHIFMFDDDCYPRVKDWYVPYIESGEPHLMYIFRDIKGIKLNDTDVLYVDSNITGYSHPRGCMLYYRNICLKVAGGMDISYCRWGFEHGDLSNRIYNLGLTSFRFADVTGSEKLIYSHDEENTVKTTVPYSERVDYLKNMRVKYKMSFNSKAYMPYKDYKFDKKRSVILTCYLNSVPDVQRGKTWEADYSVMSELIKSANKNKLELVILHNCFNEPDTEYVKHVFVEQGIDPYFQRWLTQWQYLRNNPDIDKVFCVDATDVEILRNPFKELDERVIYTGDEPTILGCPWMKNITRLSSMRDYFLENRTKTLLNCGVVGGSRENVMNICKDMFEAYFGDCKSETIDMPVYNFLVYTKYKDIIEHGRKITSVFKAYEIDSKAWFRHK